MLHILGRVARFCLRGLGYFLGVLLVLYGLIYVQYYFRMKLIRLEMPGGSYFAPAYWLSRPWPVVDKIAFYRADGKMLMQPNVDFICFNDRFVRTSFHPPGRGFIYEAGADDVVHRSDPAYDDMVERTKAYGDGSGCEGAFGTWTGYALLLHSDNPNVKTREVFDWLFD